MASNSLRKASLQSMEAEIESLLKSLENLKIITARRPENFYWVTKARRPYLLLLSATANLM